MDKIKEINEFDSILDYYKYLEESMKELTEKVSNTTSNKLKNFYSEQLDVAMKKRNSIRSVVFAQKNKILHDKLSNIKAEQVNNFIKSKKEEKNQLSKQKLDLELNISFYEAVKDFSKNFMIPIAGDANNYNCSDFYISDKAFNKFYLFKDDDNNLGEFTGLMILSKYLKGNFSVLNKITKRHEMKEKFLHKYIDEVKEKYPDYSEDKVYELATNNLNSHSPEFLDTINKKYDFNSDEYKALSEAFSAFEADCKYIKEFDIGEKQKELNDLNLEINCLSNISDSTNLENYILKEFDVKQAKVKMFKTAAETLESDSEISKYINKNNLIKGFELSPETKLSYSEQLKEQNKLLTSIGETENNIVNNDNSIKQSQVFLKRLKNTQKLVEDIGVSESAIKEISTLVEEYNTNYIVPLDEAKQNYESFKNSQNLGLIPYKKIGFFERIAGIFNGKNKIQAEFDNKCREFENNIKVLSNKAAINKPNYSFSDDNKYKKEIGQSIKQYLYENPNCSDYTACKKVLTSFTTDLNGIIQSFKLANIDSIHELDNCYSYSDICKCISNKIDSVQNLIEEEKAKKESLSMNKMFLCSKYNENSTMPISPIATSVQIGNTQNEFKKQLQKIYDYKGESQDILKYKIEVENILENDTSFLSDSEIKDLDNSAYKTAENIINDAANEYLKAQIRN